MVKVKNTKRNNADAISVKKEAQHKKSLNPFEVHINNEKIKVLGRKLKNDRGLPGISRAKALAKRKHTLLPEFKLQHKSNRFHDKRIGEKDKGLSAEDKSMARYTAVRVKQHNKKSIFNLADDEILTHRGQTLSEIEKFDDPKSDDEDPEDSGKLDRKFVEDVHFGGGMLKKADGAKSHKDLIEQLIIESKKRKAEMQKQKEATLELTEKLDSEWKDLLPLVNKKQKTDEIEAETIKVKVDDYDKIMRELKFEARGTPSDKLKTEDEIAIEEKEKLEVLERERLERMRGIVDQPKASKHRGADDLDDDFAYDDDIDVDEDIMLSYNNEGKSNVTLDINIDNKEDSNLEKEPSDNDGMEDGDSGEEECDDESDAETNDDLSDLKESDSETEAEELEETKPITLQLAKKTTSISENNTTKSKTGILKNTQPVAKEKEEVKQLPSAEEIKEDLFRRKEIMEKARNELPYTYALPENYQTLQETLTKHSPEHQGIIIERMIKCNHPSLKEGNKSLLELLFVYILQHLNDLCADIEDKQMLRETFKVFANVTPYLFDLMQLSPENAATSLLEVIKEKQNEFRGKKTYPNVDVVLYLKLISCLFSTSDYKHHVVNPAMIFMEQLLTRCRVKTKRDVAYGLFIVCLVMEYTILSKRYLPASILFLNGIVHMAIPKHTVRLLKVLPPFKSESSLLVMTNKSTEGSSIDKMHITDLFNSSENVEIDENFKHRVFKVTISLLKNFFLQYQSLPSCYEIFEPTLNYLKLLPLNNYNDSLTNDINNFIGSLENFKSNRTLTYCQMNKPKPKALRLYEPNIVKIYDAKSHKVQSKEKAERDKLLYKLKKEKKGALREIRRDKAFLGRFKLDKKIKSDAERRDKVKRIYSEASIQQSELNALDRSNNRKKKK